MLWDFPNGVSDAQALSDYAKSLGAAIGAINSNVFHYGRGIWKEPRDRRLTLNYGARAGMPSPRPTQTSR